MGWYSKQIITAFAALLLFAAAAFGQPLQPEANFRSLRVQGASPIVLEGTTADAFETTMAVTDPTADNTITIPDASGVVALNGQIGTGELDTDDCSDTETFLKAGGVWTCGVPTATEADTLDTAFDRGKTIDGANSLANAVRIGDGTTPMCHYTDATLGPVVRPCTDSNVETIIPTNFTWALYDLEGAAAVETVDPDAASKNAIYQYGTAYKPVASAYVSLTERGATTIELESIVSNQPKAYWATVTDANTDALDFHLPITAKMVGITTVTVRLTGVSKNAAPSGNIVLTCAVQAIRPGTDTYVAHSTTGEQTVTLTPATQNRPVAATSPAITINGTVADGGELWGSCEVDATGTTSAQMTDFRAKASALVQWVVNSRSD